MTQTAVSTEETSPPAREAQRGLWVAVLFATTSFLGAGLLFMIQPLAAKLILPSFGGSATVWSTSSLLFQLLLLAGYIYAHISTRRLGARWQPRVHIVLLALPLLALPIALPAQAAPSSDDSPVLWLLRTLLLMVGLPFAVLSTTGPLIQRWYAWSDGPRADDPYFLFAGSNFGSFIGLLAYPFAIEPFLTLTEQRMWWSATFAGFLVLMAACALLVRGRSMQSDVTPTRITPPPRRQLLLWCFWAFLPSSLMLAATAHLSTDIAAVPLLWVLPLAAYLASFVLAFARRSRTVPARVVLLCVVFAVSTGVISGLGSNALAPVVALVVVANIVGVGLGGYAGHARLAASRPDPAHLTLFYLVVSVGGALGGLLNGVVAPLLFDGVWEYFLTVALLPALAVGLSPSRFSSRGVLVGASSALALLTVVGALFASGRISTIVALVVVGAIVVAGIVTWLTMRAPVGLMATLLTASVCLAVVQEQSALLTERTFYGSYRVRELSDQHILLHGTTVHGTQFLDESLAKTPTTYYARQGPFGELMAVASPSEMAVVGLGAGAIAAYGGEVSHLKFFEIDPVVSQIAHDARWFSYLANSAARVDVVIGDGRLQLAEQPAGSFDVVALDAFSSDSIPVHLLTREAIGLFLDRLRPEGLLAVHISNRIFDLKPVLAAHAADFGLHAVVGRGGEGPGATVSEWVVLTRSARFAEELAAKDRWSPLSEAKSVEWTDDYSSVLSVLR